MTPPIRTCVACRTRAPQAELLRIVAVDGRASADPSRALPGRGAYLHRSAQCWELALKRRALSRALGGVEIDETALSNALTA